MASRGEIFNPNPVVFSTTRGSGRKSELSPHSLWINDDSGSDSDGEDKVEPIDQDEIFGAKKMHDTVLNPNLRFS